MRNGHQGSHLGGQWLSILKETKKPGETHLDEEQGKAEERRGGRRAGGMAMLNPHEEVVGARRKDEL